MNLEKRRKRLLDLGAPVSTHAAHEREQDHMKLPEAPIPSEGFVVTHFLTVRDQAESRTFYVGILGGKVLNRENPCVIKLANSWVILNNGGGPTPDKPGISLEPPQSRTRVNSFLNLRVADIQASY